MHDLISNMWQQLAERPSGPMAFRFYLQPLMAIALAVIDGIKDARADRPAFLWTLATDPANRAERWRDGWRSIGRVFMLAIALDVVYEIIVLHALHPLESLIVATALALVPYMLLRGPVSRIARIFMHRAHHA
jgi:hypothetical protein